MFLDSVSGGKREEGEMREGEREGGRRGRGRAGGSTQFFNAPNSGRLIFCIAADTNSEFPACVRTKWILANLRSIGFLRNNPKAEVRNGNHQIFLSKIKKSLASDFFFAIKKSLAFGYFFLL
jgi:hypothetical protein